VTEQAIACAPGAIPAGERAEHFALAARLFTEAAISRTPLSNGYEIKFPAETLISVAQFVTNERLCCPFMRFDIEMQAGNNVLVLRMTGPAGTRDVIDAELHVDACKPTGCGCHVA
jgi:hypothetical protein